VPRQAGANCGADCPRRQEVGDYERAPAEIIRPYRELSDHERRELAEWADFVQDRDMCSLVFPAYLEGYQAYARQEAPEAVRYVARRIAAVDRKGLHFRPAIVAFVLREFVRVNTTRGTGIEGDIRRRCLQWLDEPRALIAFDCLKGWWWAVPVKPPDEVRETVNGLARDAVMRKDGHWTDVVRSRLEGDGNVPCLRWLEETKAQVAMEFSRGWWWAMPVELPDDLAGTLNDLASAAVANLDGDWVGVVRSKLRD
jgi:hypothetical protein